MRKMSGIRIDPQYEVRADCVNCHRLNQELKQAREIIRSLTMSETPIRPVSPHWEWMLEKDSLL